MKLILILVPVFAVLATVPKSAFAVDEPLHRVLLKDGNIEIRQYDPMIVAEVTVTGNMRRASSNGFGSLANFIFGNNEPAQKIDMTAPVTRTKSTKIDMTAPVTRVANSDKSWTVAFVMPAKWTIETLPRPKNSDITIREVDAETVATIRFSGRAGEKDHRRKMADLEAWLQNNGYEITGRPRFAGYDHPAVPGPFRRNEVMIPVVKSSQL